MTSACGRVVRCVGTGAESGFQQPGGEVRTANLSLAWRKKEDGRSFLRRTDAHRGVLIATPPPDDSRYHGLQTQTGGCLK